MAKRLEHTYKVLDSQGNDVTDTVLVVPRSKFAEPRNNEVEELLRAIEELLRAIEDGHEHDRVRELIDSVRKWNIELNASCKVILGEADRFFSEGNDIIERVEFRHKQLKGAVRELLQDMTEESSEKTVMKLKQLVGTFEGDPWHDCPDCECAYRVQDSQED